MKPIGIKKTTCYALHPELGVVEVDCIELPAGWRLIYPLEGKTDYSLCDARGCRHMSLPPLNAIDIVGALVRFARDLRAEK